MEINMEDYNFLLRWSGKNYKDIYKMTDLEKDMELKRAALNYQQAIDGGVIPIEKNEI